MVLAPNKAQCSLKKYTFVLQNVYRCQHFLVICMIRMTSFKMADEISRKITSNISHYRPGLYQHTGPQTACHCMCRYPIIYDAWPSTRTVFIVKLDTTFFKVIWLYVALCKIFGSFATFDTLSRDKMVAILQMTFEMHFLVRMILYTNSNYNEIHPGFQIGLGESHYCPDSMQVYSTLTVECIYAEQAKDVTLF